MNFDKIKSNLQWLRSEDGVINPENAIDLLSEILKPLFEAENLILSKNEFDNVKIDLLALSTNNSKIRNEFKDSVGIEYKHYGQGKPIGINEINELLNMSNHRVNPFDRLMMIGRFGFTEQAIDKARKKEPFEIELLDLNGIEAWIERLEAGKPDNIEQVQILIRSISHAFAELVAKDPNMLDHLEWRDLERMMARIMEGLGFQCTLTPPSKDGGKDLILYWNALNGEQSYVIELKHWRSGKRVGKEAVSDFMNVIISENRNGGLFLSTYGYTANKNEGLTEITRDKLRFGEKEKIALLSKSYVRACSGLWSPPTILTDVLFEHTE